MKKRVAILISGGGSNMRALVEDMRDPDHPAQPVLVVSNSANAAGLAFAKAQGIATIVVDHRPFAADRAAFDAALMAAIAPHQIDLICLAGFMRKLTPGFVEFWAGRILNIHPSLLPKYKGLHTHARALAAGDTEHGCSVHE